MSESQNIEYSVVIPVYNASSTLEELFSGIHKVLQSMDVSCELIFVDDQSTDDSWEVLKSIKSKAAEIVTIVLLEKNHGQTYSTLCGLEQASGNYLITMDDDLSIDPENIKGLIKSRVEADADLCYGYFEKEDKVLIRKIGSWLMDQIFRSAVQKDLSMSNGGSSFRIMDQTLYQLLKNYPRNIVIPDIPLLNISQKLKFYKIKHVKSTEAAPSSYNPLKLLILGAEVLIYHGSLYLIFALMTGITLLLFVLLMKLPSIHNLIADKLLPLILIMIFLVLLLTTGIFLLRNKEPGESQFNFKIREIL